MPSGCVYARLDRKTENALRMVAAREQRTLSNMAGKIISDYLRVDLGEYLTLQAKEVPA